MKKFNSRLAVVVPADWMMDDPAALQIYGQKMRQIHMEGLTLNSHKRWKAYRDYAAFCGFNACPERQHRRRRHGQPRGHYRKMTKPPK